MSPYSHKHVVAKANDLTQYSPQQVFSTSSHQISTKRHWFTTAMHILPVSFTSQHYAYYTDLHLRQPTTLSQPVGYMTRDRTWVLTTHNSIAHQLSYLSSFPPTSSNPNPIRVRYSTTYTSFTPPPQISTLSHLLGMLSSTCHCTTFDSSAQALTTSASTRPL